MPRNSKLALMAFLPAVVFFITLMYFSVRYVFFNIPTDVDKVFVTFTTTILLVLVGGLLAVFLEAFFEE